MTAAETKLCSRCGERPRTGKQSYCRPCASEYEKDRRNKNKDELNKRKRESYDPRLNFERHLRQKYKLTVAEYAWMLYHQGFGCTLCGRFGNLHVDHDHYCCPGEKSCGTCVRGLLCQSCNNGLGRFEDDHHRLRRAADYVELARLQQGME